MPSYSGAGKVRSIASKADSLLRMLSNAINQEVQPWGRDDFADQAGISSAAAIDRFRRLMKDGLIAEHHRASNSIFYVVTPTGVEYLRANIDLLSGIDLENCDPEGHGRAFLESTPPSVEAQELLKLLEEEGSESANGSGKNGKNPDGASKDTRKTPNREQQAVLRLVRICGGYGGVDHLSRVGSDSPDINPDTLMKHLDWLEDNGWIKVQYKPDESDRRTWYWVTKGFTSS